MMLDVYDRCAKIEALVQTRGNEWLEFAEPVRTIGAEAASDVPSTLREVERLTRDEGWHAVGFLTYEASAAFGLGRDPAGDLGSRAAPDWPLAWFALFHPSTVSPARRPVPRGGYTLGPVTASLSREAFTRAFDRIKRHIADGDCYQANLTFALTATFEGTPRDLFADLVEAQRGAHSAYLAIGARALCSASPELFFELDGQTLRSRPMKGTSRRGRTTVEDAARREALVASAKERAENVMIVDMMRNDLGRIAELGTVIVPELFNVERYPTVWQMTSRVHAQSSASLDEVFAALHPPASVTGAPKGRTMEILAGVESGPRGIYTGTIGYVPPGGGASFNVAIRTAVVDGRARSVSFGVGSGIVWDSDADAEYDECLLKGAVLGRRPLSFELLETLRWTPEEGFFLLDRHLDRLQDSAAYFGRSCQVEVARETLRLALEGETSPRRVRFLLGPAGEMRVERAPLVANTKVLTVKIAARPIDRADVWLFHKTTHRAVYDAARADNPEVDEVLLWNAQQEVTEATTANLVVQIDGLRVTPPVESGLLAGTFRAELLARGVVRERVVTLDQVRSAPMWLINSVHEWRRAAIVS